MSISDVCDRAVSALLFITKGQLFIDGNKRTSAIYTNHVLISAGAGFRAILEENVPDYKQLLVDYYETDEAATVRKFLLDQCLARLG
jgi:prophage maintenance system killer protein